MILRRYFFLALVVVFAPSWVMAMPPCGNWEEEALSTQRIDECEVRISRSSCTDADCLPDDRGWIDPSCLKRYARVLDSKGDLRDVFVGDEAEIVDVDHESVDLVLLVRKYAAASYRLQYILYVTEPDLKKLGEIDTPISEWQANRRKGSGRKPDGFYRDRKGSLLIDRLVLRDLGVSRSRDEYDVETLKVGRDGLVSLGRRDLDVDTYTRYTLPVSELP